MEAGGPARRLEPVSLRREVLMAAIAAAAVLVGGLALELVVSQPPPDSLVTASIAPATCGVAAAFRAERDPGGTSFVADTVEGGSMPLAKLVYEVSGANMTSREAGSFLAAARESRVARVRYHDATAPADALNPGDVLRAAFPGDLTLTVRDSAGRFLGGTWGCA